MRCRVPRAQPGQRFEAHLRVDVVHDVVADVARREAQGAGQAQMIVVGRGNDRLDLAIGDAIVGVFD